MAELKFDFYHNENNYSDGQSIEDKILDLVKSGTPIDFGDPEKINWTILYHLSPLRENILNWYPFRTGCSILEIGSGCGAITGLLCQKAKSVVSIELTEKRARICNELLTIN